LLLLGRHTIATIGLVRTNVGFRGGIEPCRIVVGSGYPVLELPLREGTLSGWGDQTRRVDELERARRGTGRGLRRGLGLL